jgi:hypothetical protein
MVDYLNGRLVLTDTDGTYGVNNVFVSDQVLARYAVEYNEFRILTDRAIGFVF